MSSSFTPTNSSFDDDVNVPASVCNDADAVLVLDNTTTSTTTEDPTFGTVRDVLQDTAQDSQDSPLPGLYSPTKPFYDFDGYFDDFMRWDGGNTTSHDKQEATSNVVEASPWDMLHDPVFAKSFDDRCADFNTAPGSMPSPLHVFEEPAIPNPPLVPTPFPVPSADEKQDLLNLLHSYAPALAQISVPLAIDPKDVIPLKCATYPPPDMPPSPFLAPATPRLDFIMNKDDLNLIDHMDAYSSDERPLAAGSSSSSFENDDTETLDYSQMSRHYWIRGDIRYMVKVNGRRFKMKAEDLDERYYGVRMALWSYWQQKRRGRVPMDKLRAHLRFKGCSGFFSEMLWHLLTDEELEYLINMRRKRMLHKVTMDSILPKGPKELKGPKGPKGSKGLTNSKRG